MTAADADLAAEVDRLRAELEAERRRADDATRQRDEASQREAALADILRVVNGATSDLQPVFAAILEAGVRLCAAQRGSVWLPRGPLWTVTAVRGFNDAQTARLLQRTRPLSAYNPIEITARERRTFHEPDLQRWIDTVPDADERTRLHAGFAFLEEHSGLCVPLLRGEEVVGVLAFDRQAPTPFSTVTSAPGQGSTCTMRLPALVAAGGMPA